MGGRDARDFQYMPTLLKDRPISVAHRRLFQYVLLYCITACAVCLAAVRFRDDCLPFEHLSQFTRDHINNTVLKRNEKRDYIINIDT